MPAVRPFNPRTAVEMQQRTLGPFRVVKSLTTGSTFELFLGVQPEPWGLGRPVVIRRVRPEVASDPTRVRHLLRAYAQARRFDHVNVVRVLDASENAPELGYAAAELVAGLPLSAILEVCARARRFVPAPVAAQIIAACATGLEHVYAQLAAMAPGQPVAHGGLSPRKVLVSFDGEVKVLGAGVEHPLGRRRTYASPEERRTGVPTAQSDLFTLGAMLFELIGGVPLVGAGGAGGDELVARQLSEVAAWRAAPQALRDVVARCLSLNLGDRFSCPEAVAVALSEVANDDQQPGRAVGEWLEGVTGDLARRWRSEVEALVERAVTQVMWGGASDGQGSLRDLPRATRLFPNEVSDEETGPVAAEVLPPAPARKGGSSGRVWVAAAVVGAVGIFGFSRRVHREEARAPAPVVQPAAPILPPPPPVEPPPPPALAPVEKVDTVTPAPVARVAPTAPAKTKRAPHPRRRGPRTPAKP